ncbi:uncharacterized protein [Eurosta solidaginis]|uniref:uncharacterized protein n=1 Tax=Eurosta solidaginis TaxID=178769 RepID=UPI0035306EA7
MSLTPEDLKTVLGALAGAIRGAVEEAAQNAAANTNVNRSVSPKPPPFSITEYKSEDKSSVQDYLTRVDWALQLSKVAEAEQHKFVRVHMGAELNTALTILVSPKTPDSLNYSEIKNILIRHFDGCRNKYAECIKFRQNKQEKGESICKFALRLREAAVHCEYGEFLDRMLLEQLLYGVESRVICNEVIAKKPKNFAEAYEIAHTIELTQNATTDLKCTEVIQTSEPTYKLGYAPVKTKRNSNSKTPSGEEPMQRAKEKGSNCYGCGGQHLRKDCKFNNSKCFACGRVGHIAKVCKAKLDQISEDECESVQKLKC